MGKNPRRRLFTGIMERRNPFAAGRRDNGIYYTPEDLAYFAAKNVVCPRARRIIDPCFGDGALLAAASKALAAYGIKHGEERLYGCEIIPESFHQVSSGMRNAHLFKRNFFDHSSSEKQKFDVVIMNPPYVRHHRINKSMYGNVITDISRAYDTDKRADLWVYFVLQSLDILRNGGSLAVILPWSFLFADYAKRVREILSVSFKSIRVIVIGKQLFADAQERVVVLLGKQFGKKANDIRVNFTVKIPSTRFPDFRRVTQEEWIENPFVSLRVPRAIQLLHEVCCSDGWTLLSSCAQVRIGVVTGANEYFVLTRDAIKAAKLPQRYFQPIVTSSRELGTFGLKESVRKRYLLSLDSRPIMNRSLLSYINEMEKLGIHEKTHSKRRKPWYSVRIDPPADAFFPYMSVGIPYLVSNVRKVQCTNAVHKVLFQPSITDLEKRWIRLSILSSISQLSIEVNARTYGSGVLKLEPSRIGKILVHKGSKERIPKKIETKIELYLQRGEKEKAIEAATECFVQMIGLDKEIAGEAMELRKVLSQQRKSK